MLWFPGSCLTKASNSPLSSRETTNLKDRDPHGPHRLPVLPLTHQHSCSLVIQATDENTQQDNAEGSVVQRFSSNMLEWDAPQKAPSGVTLTLEYSCSTGYSPTQLYPQHGQSAWLCPEARGLLSFTEVLGLDPS